VETIATKRVISAALAAALEAAQPSAPNLGRSRPEPAVSTIDRLRFPAIVSTQPNDQ
jgi:hypothetical protein